MVTFGLLAFSRVTGTGIVNFVGANPAQGNERRDAQRGGAKEYGALGKILAGYHHVARRGSGVAACGARAASDARRRTLALVNAPDVLRSPVRPQRRPL